MNNPSSHDDPQWKDPLATPQRQHDPVTDPNVNGDPERKKETEDDPHDPDKGQTLPDPDQPTPLSDERR